MSGLPQLLAEQPHSAPVQHLGDYLGWSAGLVLLVVLVYWLMRQGWKWRGVLQSDLPALPPAPDDPGPALLTAKGRYHGTTTAGNWLDRIVAHGLGDCSLVELTLTEQGLRAHRPGTDDLWIPAAALTGARTDSAIAGKVIPSGLLVVSWAHGGVRLDSGFRADHPGVHRAWVAAIERAAATQAHAPRPVHHTPVRPAEGAS